MSRIATILAETTHAPRTNIQGNKTNGKCIHRLISHAGKDYLVLVDRYSDSIFCSDALSKTNTSTILNVLIKWFKLFGYQSVIRSDVGPQFRSEFDNFCASKNITHELASPYNPQSNGLAENAVKQAKHLLIKSLENNENFH